MSIVNPIAVTGVCTTCKHHLILFGVMKFLYFAYVLRRLGIASSDCTLLFCKLRSFVQAQDIKQKMNILKEEDFFFSPLYGNVSCNESAYLAVKETKCAVTCNLVLAQAQNGYGHWPHTDM